jgi:hypothetical protein
MKGFVQKIESISAVVEKIIKYLQKLEKRDFDISPEDIQSFEEDTKYNAQ